jgi:hypothetical protein
MADHRRRQSERQVGTQGLRSTALAVGVPLGPIATRYLCRRDVTSSTSAAHGPSGNGDNGSVSAALHLSGHDRTASFTRLPQLDEFSTRLASVLQPSNRENLSKQSFKIGIEGSGLRICKTAIELTSGSGFCSV